MNTLNQLKHALAQITATLFALGLLCGLIIAFGVLAGDEQGRVNLLYLLVLFAFLPVAGLVISMAMLAFGAGSALSRALLRLPLWPGKWQRQIMLLARHNAQKPWFLYQSQVLALSFGLGGLAAFFLLLIGSDVSFVWRSTLLEAGDLLPLLRVLALPWLFWDAAQPSLELLQQTQDFRLAPPDYQALVLGQWWKYIFAAQCAYNLLPRTLMLVLFRVYYRRHLHPLPAVEENGNGAHIPLNVMPPQGRLAEVSHHLEQDYRLVNWAAAPPFCLDEISRHLRPPNKVVKAGPGASLEDEAASLQGEEIPVVVVKSWEPPMGELKDYLDANALPGFVLPLDWSEERVSPTQAGHLREWQRFCGELGHWRLLQPEAAR